MRFILGELNNAADLLSRWYEGKKNKVEVNSVKPAFSELQQLHVEGHWGTKKLAWLCKKKD